MLSIIIWQAVWAASIPISKLLLSYSPPIFLAGVRMVSAGAVLLGYHYSTRRERIRLPKTEWLIYAQVIFFGIYAKYILRYIGLSSMPSTKLAFMLNLTPFCVALCSYIAFTEILLRRQWIGLIIGFLGFFPLLMLNTGGYSFITWADGAVIAEILAHSYSVILLRKLVREKQHCPSMTNGIRMFGGGMLALTTSLYTEPTQHIQNLGYFCIWLAVLIVLSNIICHNWHLHLLKRYSATFLTFADFLGPLFVSIYGWLLFNETISWHYGISATCVVLGLYLFYYDELRAQKKDVTGATLAQEAIPGLIPDEKPSQEKRI